MFDNTVNIGYVLTKLLRRAGLLADLVRSAGAPFNQQPAWEDLDLERPSGEAEHSTGASYWRAIEEEHGWAQPEWMRTPVRRIGDVSVATGNVGLLHRAMPTTLLPFGALVAGQAAPAARCLASYDAVVVQGPSAAAAYLAGRPYVVLTTGWDVRVLPFMTSARNPIHRARAWLQRAALRNAARILMTLPAHDLQYIERLGLTANAEIAPAPADVDGHPPLSDESLASIFGEDAATRLRDRMIVFCPSRIEFALKGTDKLIRGFAKARGLEPSVGLVMLDWGRDAGRARELVRSLGISDDVVFHPYLLSRPRLMRAFAAVDVVADQFDVGAYGALARDALAAGRPVISSYDSNAPQPHPHDDPAPISAAVSEGQIARAILELRDAETRRRASSDARAWTRRNHQDVAAQAVISALRAAVAQT